MSDNRKLLHRLEKMKRAVLTGIPQALEKEVQLRTNQASSGFSSAQYHGNNDVTVSMDSQIGSGDATFRINATGESVLFIEYGTGLRYKHDSEFGDYGAYPPASWSETHSRFLVEPLWYQFRDWWPLPSAEFGKNAYTLGDPSANVMYNTKKTLEEQVPIKAEGALGKAMS